jgi:hydroxymethylpyrimidine pyrophosphatase-like HAD family hydrolase
MRYTAIALDYDGTIAHDGGVPPHVMDGLRACAPAAASCCW